MGTNNTSLKGQIYASILNDIIQGVYSQNQVLNEKSLMERFNVSRAPIREALIELCNEKVLYSIPYYGYKITPLTAEDISDAKSFRCILECGFMREYWHKFTPEILENLTRLHQEQVENREESDAITHWNNNIGFHLALFDVYGNKYAYQKLRSAMSLQTRAYAQTRWEEWHSHLFYEVPAFHGIMLEAIKKGEKDTAIHLLNADIISI